jgi:hypothetical protein
MAAIIVKEEVEQAGGKCLQVCWLWRDTLSFNSEILMGKKHHQRKVTKVTRSE